MPGLPHWKSLWRWVLILGALFVISAIAGGYAYLRSTVPDYVGLVNAPEIRDNIEIIRDSFGMAHIYASNDEEAAFAFGYATAQDRLFQMDIIRRTIRGRLAEILGEKTVKVDRLFRVITAKRSADSLYTLLSPEVKSCLTAYAAGVNRYMESHQEKLSWEFGILGYTPERWLPADCLAGQFFIAWGLNFSFDNELLRAAIAAKVGPEMLAELFIDYPATSPTIIPNGAVMGTTYPLLDAAYAARESLGLPFRGASNNWVVAGEKSTSGKPLLTNRMFFLPGRLSSSFSENCFSRSNSNSARFRPVISRWVPQTRISRPSSMIPTELLMKK